MNKYGLLLPHFSEHASRDHLVTSARQIEQYGFDSVWARDHLIFRPHLSESQTRVHLDPLVVLSAVAGATKRLILGTAVLIPHRHPIHAALLLSSLEFIAGPNRVIAGWGAGFDDREFDAVGMRGWNRPRLVEEHITICRRLWRGEAITHRGHHYNFEDVDIYPVPRAPIPIWYGGESPAAVRRAVEHSDGWIPGRLPRRDYAKRMDRLRQLAEKADKPVPSAALIPYASPGRTMEAAVCRLNVQMLCEEARGWGYMAPPSGRFDSLEDLDGMMMAGPADHIVQEVRKYQALGTEHVVFDLRMRFAEWDECVAMIGEEVLPQLHRGDGRL